MDQGGGDGLGGDCEGRSGDLLLEVGELSFRYHPRINELLFKGKAQTFEERLVPIALTLDGCVLQYAGLPLSIDGVPCPLTGSLDLKAGEVDLEGSLPIAVVGERAGVDPESLRGRRARGR